MTKTKRNLIIIGSIVGVFVVLMIVFGALLSLKKVQVDFRSLAFETEFNYTKEEIIQTADLKKGKSIVLLDTDKAKSKLEKEFPYAEFKLVRTFPNRITIYVYIREAVFKVQNKNSSFEIYDRDFKCLEIVDYMNLNEDHKNIPTLQGVDLTLAGEEGLFMKEPEFQEKMATIADGVYGVGGTNINGLMTDIVFTYDNEKGCDILTLTLKSKAKIIIQDTTKNLFNKVADATMVYVIDVSQDEYYVTLLEQVTITLLRNYDSTNQNLNKIIIYPEKP